MRMNLILAALLFSVFQAWLTTGVDAVKVLLFQNAFGQSHIGFSDSLVKALHNNGGHVVDEIILKFNPGVRLSGTSPVRNRHVVSLPDGRNSFLKLSHLTQPFGPYDFHFVRGKGDFYGAMGSFCEELISNKAWMARLAAERYDILLASPYNGCPMGLHHVLQIPAMIFFVATPSTDLIPEFMGVVMPPSFVSSVLRSQGTDRLSFSQRLNNVIELIGDHFGSNIFAEEQAAFSRYYTDVPPLYTLVRRATYLMLNTDEIIDLVKPMTPKVKYIGGIGVPDPRSVPELNQDFENIVNRPSKGIIMMSFGSIVKTSQIPYAKKVELIAALSSFSDYTVLWKYDDIDDDAQLFANSTNIFLRKWLPQTTLLRHPRMKVFITHMGLNSYLEMSHAGVPAVAIPIFVDQFYNSGCAVKNGVAVRLCKLELSRETLTNALKEILNNPSYARRAKEISKMIARKPDRNDAKRFVEYVEYAAAFPELGTEIYQIASADMNIAQLYCVDVLAFLLACALVAITVTVIMARYVLRYGSRVVCTCVTQLSTIVHVQKRKAH